MRIAIFGTTYDHHYNQCLQDVVNILGSNGASIVFEKTFRKYIDGQITLSGVETAEADSVDADIAISFGGDGTFLATSQMLAKKGTPILGINAGHLGFLADVSAHELEQVLLDILSGRYKIEKRVMLQMKLSNDTDTSHTALNEIAILRHDTSSMIAVDVTIDGEFVANYKSDGLLVATPTGSTAYSLSLGGPIVSPNSANFLIVPIVSHSLTVRPLVIRDDCRIDVCVKSRSGNYRIGVDGHSINLDESTTIAIEKSRYQTNSIQPLDHTFFRTLSNKLMWGADTRV